MVQYFNFGKKNLFVFSYKLGAADIASSLLAWIRISTESKRSDPRNTKSHYSAPNIPTPNMVNGQQDLEGEGEEDAEERVEELGGDCNTLNLRNEVYLCTLSPYR
ncbi:uncharacterized protein [Malus domestica]|uniref:uncharacterized protein n=1 Tax=Malus domestica TaxID=3750 RepID=UPI003976DFB5